MLMTTMESVLSIVVMVVIGYILTHKKWFDEKSTNLIVKLITNISLPALMVYTLMSSFSKEQLKSSAFYLIVPFMSIFIAYFIGMFLSKVLKITPSRKGLFVSLFFNSNTIFMGLPINEALFGPSSVPFVLLYYIANTTLFWTLGIFEITKDGSGPNNKTLSLDTLKKIISPPLMGYIVGVILIMLGVKLPIFIMDSCKYLGNLSTPLSMMFIGVTIYSIDIKKLRFSIEMFTIMLGRFLVSPIIVIILCVFFPMPKLMKDVFVIQAAMPVMTNSAIVSKAYDADYEFAAIMISVTTLASIFVIPIYRMVLG